MAVFQNSTYFFQIKLLIVFVASSELVLGSCGTGHSRLPTIPSIQIRQKNDQENTDEGEKRSDLGKVKYTETAKNARCKSTQDKT